MPVNDLSSNIGYFCTLGVGVVFSHLHIRYVGDYSRANDATNSLYIPLFLSVAMSSYAEINVFVVYSFLTES
jgi:hypothetical protein